MFLENHHQHQCPLYMNNFSGVRDNMAVFFSWCGKSYCHKQMNISVRSYDDLWQGRQLNPLTFFIIGLERTTIRGGVKVIWLIPKLLAIRFDIERGHEINYWAHDGNVNLKLDSDLNVEVPYKEECNNDLLNTIRKV